MKVVFLGNHNLSAWLLRREFFASMIHNGCEVIAILPNGEKTQALNNIGVEVRPIFVKRFISPFLDICYLFKVYRLLKKIKPDVVFTNSIKPNTYGMIAAHWARVPQKVGGVAGIGRGFDPPKNWRDRIINQAVLMLYKMGGKRTDMYWFQNPDDLELFNHLKIVPPEKSLLVRGSGINTNDFSTNNIDEAAVQKLRDELKISSDTVVITMIGRVNWLKGFGDFFESSRIAQTWDCNVCFLLVGARDPYIKESVLKKMLKQTSTFQWLGKRVDIKNILSLSDIVTLPSYYREGVPRSLLEGMAMGKPIVTTDSPGCRETVEDGVNGYLVPPKNPAVLAATLKKLVDDKEKRLSFGKESLRKATQEFSYYTVYRKILENMLRIKNPVIPIIKTSEDDNNIIFIDSEHPS